MKYDRYEAIVDEAHKMGIKVAVSNRMGLWGAGYPYHYYGCGVRFVDEHPELHCVDRNGEMVNALSYAYPEVRRLKIRDFIAAAKCGADAVMPLGHRGVPYVLFEKPVVDAFYEKYGEYPFELPLDEPRLRDIHCGIMVQYFRELREALDNEFGKNKIQIHLRCYNSIEDSAYIGFDVYNICFGALFFVELTAYTQGNNQLSLMVAGGAVIIALFLRKYLEMLVTAAAGGIGVAFFMQKLFDYTVNNFFNISV